MIEARHEKIKKSSTTKESPDTSEISTMQHSSPPPLPLIHPPLLCPSVIRHHLRLTLEINRTAIIVQLDHALLQIEKAFLLTYPANIKFQSGSGDGIAAGAFAEAAGVAWKHPLGCLRTVCAFHGVGDAHCSVG